MDDPRERRTHSRLDVILKVEYDDARDFVADYASNASGGGIFIATQKPFLIDEELSFDISFPGLLSPIRCRGVVCWRRPPRGSNAEEPAGIGVSFRFDSAEEADRIDALIHQLGQLEPTAEPAAESPFRVLLAEPCDELRGVFLSAFRAFDNLTQTGGRSLEVTEAKTGRQAWQHIERAADGSPLDLAIISVHLDEQSGEQLIRDIRERESYRSEPLPIIAIGIRCPQTQHDAYLAGADLYLDQPVEMAQLFHSLHRFIHLEERFAL